MKVNFLTILKYFSAAVLFVCLLMPAPAYADSREACTGRGGSWTEAGALTSGSCSVPAASTADDIGCFTGAGGAGNTMAVCVSNLVYYIMVGVFSSLAYVAAFFFDMAVQLSLNSTTYALEFLTTSWTIVRDLSNMAFIFILIYIAVSVMLTADSSQTIKTLAMVVVVALLVNFSFFFTRVAIDAGNLLALQFYNAIEGHTIGSNSSSGLGSILNQGSTNTPNPTNAANFMSGFTALASDGNTKDLTASIMDGIQVQNIVNSESFKRYIDPSNKNQSSMYILITLSTIYIAVGIAFGILAGSFLYAGAKFMMRIVGLWFVIIFSPLALVAAALPSAGANKLFKDWLKHLVNFSFYPAAFLFMFFVLTRFMKELNKGGNFISGVFSSSNTGLADGSFGFVTILSAIANVGIRLGFVVAMMYLALSAADILAKSRGDITSGRARQWAGWVGSSLTGLTGGTVAWAGRNTLGRAGQAAGVGLLANRTYDPRNIPVLGHALRGFKPATEVPHQRLGAIPVDLGGVGTNKKMGLRPQPQPAAAQPAPGPAQQPAPNNPPAPNAPIAVPAVQGQRQAANDNNPPAANDNVLQPRRAVAQTSSAPTPSNRTMVAQGADIQKILQEFNEQNIKNIKGTVDSSLANNLGRVQKVVDSSVSKNLASLPTIKPVSTTSLKSEVSDETLDKMKKMMRKVIRAENADLAESSANNRPSELPKSPAGGAMRPPAATNDNKPDISRAA